MLSEWALCHAAFENLHPWDKLRGLICRNHTSDLRCPQSAVTVALNMREPLLLRDQSIGTTSYKANQTGKPLFTSSRQVF